MEMDVGKIELMRILREPSAVQIVIDQKQPEIVQYFDHFGRMITNDALCTLENNPGCHGKNNI